MKKVFLLFAFIIAGFSLAQVGIGTDAPDSKSVLEIVSPDNNKGILIPRITEAQRDAISPADAQNGLMVYNTTEDCFNYWNRLEQVWSSICGKAGKAVFTLDCGSLSVNGQYLNSVALTSDNKLLVTVNVTKAGSYTINATSSPDNKYFFTRSGDFLSTGTYTIEIPGYGTPDNFTADGQPGDQFTVTLNGAAGDTPCTFTVKVQDSSVKPEFRMDCSTAKVYGTYQKDVQLTSSNYIEVSIRFDGALHGAPLRIYTDTVDGISFDSGSLTLDNGGTSVGMATQVVKLYGSGSPANYESKTMTISSNSTSSSSTCSVKVLVGYPKMSIYAIGDGIYNVNNANQVGNLIGSANNFGLLDTSTVKFQGWTSRTAVAGNTSAATLSTALLGSNPPDIVVFTFPYTVTPAATGAVIKQYLEKGGVVLCYMEGDGTTSTFLQTIFGTGISVGYTGGGAGQVYPFIDVADDPIIYGPFGILAGKNWGEDASTTQGVRGLNSAEFVTYTVSNNGAAAYVGSATAFRSKKYNFFFVGDGGFVSNASNSTSATAYPFWTNLTTYAPMQKPSYGASGTGGPAPTDNSTFFANALAWALERATNNGINPHN